jgi:hypothetical protein
MSAFLPLLSPVLDSLWAGRNPGLHQKPRTPRRPSLSRSALEPTRPVDRGSAPFVHDQDARLDLPLHPHPKRSRPDARQVVAKHKE